MTEISVVIPAYNEAGRIGKTLTRCLAYFASVPYSWELLVVDDGSTDATADIVKEFKDVILISYTPNHGKGYAVRKGVLESHGDYVLFSVADLSTPIEELEKLMNYIKDYDIVIASRGLTDSEAVMLQTRKFMGRIFNFFVKTLTGLYFTDTQCGFKLFTRKAAYTIFHKQTIMDWAFDVEILFIAKKLGFKIKEVGIKWEHFHHEAVTPARASLTMLSEVLKVRWNSFTGKYR